MIRSPLRLALSLGLALAGLAACGGDSAESSDSPKDLLIAGNKDVSGKEFAAALKKFDAVVASAEASATQKYRAARDSVVCQAKVNGNDGFLDSLATLIEEHPDQLDAHALAKISTDLENLQEYEFAGMVIVSADSLIAKIEDEAEREELKGQFKGLAKRIADSGKGGGALDGLRALGYLGD